MSGMSILSTSTPTGLSLPPAARERLRRRLADGVRHARRDGEVVVAVTVPAPGLDPVATAFASRRGDESLFCLEQPDRGGSAIGALGAAQEIVAAGRGRFTEVASRWRALAARALADPPAGPPASGLAAVTGFSFAPHGGASAAWSEFPSAVLTVPETLVARRDGEVVATFAVTAGPGDDPEALLADVEARAAELVSRPLPLLDPSPTTRSRVASALPPEHYEEAVARAVERIRSGAFEKIVLAREVAIEAPSPHDPAAVLGILREAFPSCLNFCVARGAASFVGASPELLVRREGQRACSVALAGSTRRSADPAVDDHLGERLVRSAKDREEQHIVTRRIEQALGPYALWVTAAPEPVLVKVANVQHLATPIRAQLARPTSVLELGGALHPTPAVGGEPARDALPAIPALEGMDRGWYAGALGWIDAAEDGELCVALRCALLSGPTARAYAGVGVVRDSDPAAELAETEVKLGALLPLLAS